MSGASRKSAMMVSGLNLAGKLLGLGKTLLIAGLFAAMCRPPFQISQRLAVLSSITSVP